MYQGIYIYSIGGYTLRQPSKATMTEIDVYAEGSGRALSAKGQFFTIAQKRQIQMAFNAITPAEANAIETAIAPTYFNVVYLDTKTLSYHTMECTKGDRIHEIIQWFDNGERLNLSFQVTER